MLGFHHGGVYVLFFKSDSCRQPHHWSGVLHVHDMLQACSAENSRGAMLMCWATDGQCGLAEDGVDTLVHALVLCRASMVPCSNFSNRFPALR